MFKYQKTGTKKRRSYRNPCGLISPITERIRVGKKKSIPRSWYTGGRNIRPVKY